MEQTKVVYVVVQFYSLVKILFLLFQTHYHVIIIHYHTQKQKKIKFEPRINLNHNIYIMCKTERLPWPDIKEMRIQPKTTQRG